MSSILSAEWLALLTGSQVYANIRFFWLAVYQLTHYFTLYPVFFFFWSFLVKSKQRFLRLVLNPAGVTIRNLHGISLHSPSWPYFHWPDMTEILLERQLKPSNHPSIPLHPDELQELFYGIGNGTRNKEANTSQPKEHNII